MAQVEKATRAQKVVAQVAAGLSMMAEYPDSLHNPQELVRSLRQAGVGEEALEMFRPWYVAAVHGDTEAMLRETGALLEMIVDLPNTTNKLQAANRANELLQAKMDLALAQLRKAEKNAADSTAALEQNRAARDEAMKQAHSTATALAKAREEAQEARSSCRDTSIGMDQLKADAKALRQAKDELQRRLREAEASGGKHAKGAAALEQEVRDLKAKLDSMKKNSEQLENEARSLENLNEGLRVAMEDAREDERGARDLERRIRECEKELKEAGKEMETQLERARRERDKLKAENQTLTVDNKKLKGEVADIMMERSLAAAKARQEAERAMRQDVDRAEEGRKKEQAKAARLERELKRLEGSKVPNLAGDGSGTRTRSGRL